MQKATGLEYEEQGHGEPLLLIHGAFIADALSLLARESALTDRYRVIWYRRPGYGGSDPVTPPFSMDDQAARARGLLEHLGVEKAHIVGHSGGGVIATALACQDPGLTRSLTVLEPAILPPAIAKAFPDMLAPAIEVYRSGDPGGGVDAFMELIGSHPNWREELARVLPDGPAQVRSRFANGRRGPRHSYRCPRHHHGFFQPGQSPGR
jgi:pimeloyl-ACP methyl ester carboxylesterase